MLSNMNEYSLETLIEQLQDYEKMYGNVEVTMCLRETADLVEVKDIIADEDGVTLYDWV